jgi:hypothetical protein
VEHARRLQELEKESAEDADEDVEDDDDNNDDDDDEPAKKKTRPVKHLGLGFGKHSKIPAEVEAEHMTPQKRVRQKTTPIKRKMPEGYISSDPSD